MIRKSGCRLRLVRAIMGANIAGTFRYPFTRSATFTLTISLRMSFEAE